MKVAIIITPEKADQNIKNNLNFHETNEEFKGRKVLNFQNLYLYEIDERSIFSENLDKEIEADLFVFATKHSSASKKPSLTCHPIGNWSKAEFGGKDRTLVKAPAQYLKQFYLSLKKHESLIESEITLEITHHGPYLETPTMFVEIGSCEEQWVNEEFGRILAQCIREVFTQEYEEEKTCIFIGGGHYNSSSNKIMERSNYAVGHMCPKYMLEHLDKEMILEAIEKTTPKADLVIVDWDGLGKSKQNVIDILENNNIKYERIKKFLKEYS
ncbi:D-aminoacyl-tRNA deacylase [Candidatus Woesearchaeota archaeon]|nr:D-aminoacyl-tRNA deacylase [Candidatus Woesearchaeota archaeon]